MPMSYCGTPPLPADWLFRWNADPVLLLGLAICAALSSRTAAPRLALSGVGILAILFVSPLCALSVALFSARAAHHVLLVAVAAPLFALALPARRCRALGPALVVATAVLWLWHLPSLYDRALTDTATYWLMQATLLGSAVWFWRELFAAPPLAAMITAVLAMAQMGMLGAVLTFAPKPLYATHVLATVPWGFDAVADQQLAGLIMWVPGVVPYAIACVLLAQRLWRGASTPA
jgi:putative membrane protein